MIPNDIDACVLPGPQALQKYFHADQSGATLAPLEVDKNNHLNFL